MVSIVLFIKITNLILLNIYNLFYMPLLLQINIENIRYLLLFSMYLRYISNYYQTNLFYDWIEQS
jgi:hypothetical protein